MENRGGRAKATFHETGSELAFPVKHRASSVSDGGGGADGCACAVMMAGGVARVKTAIVGQHI